MKRHWFRSVLVGCLVTFFCMLSIETFASSYSTEEIYKQESIFKNLKKSFLKKTNPRSKYFSRKISYFRFNPRKTKFDFSKKLIFVSPPKPIVPNDPTPAENDGSDIVDNDTGKWVTRKGIVKSDAAGGYYLVSCPWESAQLKIPIQSNVIDLSEYENDLVVVSGYLSSTLTVHKIERVPPVTLKGRLSMVNSNSAHLYDKNGMCCANLVSLLIDFRKYNDYFVEVKGFFDPTISHLFPRPIFPRPIPRRFFVFGIKAVGKAVVRTGEIVAAENDSSLAVYAKLVDNEGGLIARLYSDSINFSQYNKSIVRIAGTPRLSPDPVIAIDVKELRVLKVWKEAKGILHARSSGRATLSGPSGEPVAFLSSDAIDFTSYDNMRVWVGGHSAIIDYLIQGAIYLRGYIEAKEIRIIDKPCSYIGFVAAESDGTFVLNDNDGSLIIVLRSGMICLSDYIGCHVKVTGYDRTDYLEVIKIEKIGQLLITVRGLVTRASQNYALLIADGAGGSFVLISLPIDLSGYLDYFVEVSGYETFIVPHQQGGSGGLSEITADVTPLRFINVEEIKRIGKPITLKGRLSMVDNDTARLYGGNGYQIAILKSKIINFSRYDNCFVEVEGMTPCNQMTLPAFTIDPITGEKIPASCLIVFVKKIRIIAKYVVMEGELIALRPHIVGDRCFGRANLLDKEGNLIARLYSKTIIFSKYNKCIVRVAGTLRLSLSDTPVLDIDVKEIRALKVWVYAEGRLVASPILSNDIYPERAILYNKDGGIVAYLRSDTIKLSRYNKFYVWVGGYNNSGFMHKPLHIDVKNIRIISEPPVFEKWRGIVTENNLDWSVVADCPFILKDRAGATIGFLKGSSSILEQLKKFANNFFVEVKGEVKTLPVHKVKKMDVTAVRPIQDLRHILWMSNKPLVFKVGEKVEFNKIGDVIRPVPIQVGSADNDTPVDNDSLVDNDSSKIFVYQKYWDFDDKLYPRILPIPMVFCSLDNDSLVEACNESCVVRPLPIRCSRVKFINYDYMYDSRIKTAGIKCIDNPTFEFTKPGFYRITLTGSISDGHGIVKKVETVSRVVQVWPEVAILDPITREMIGVSTDAQSQGDNLTDEMKALYDAIMEGVEN